ncbi:MAG: hypothetical protein AB2L18_11040 [Anaerolineaceae bacterium]
MKEKQNSRKLETFLLIILIFLLQLISVHFNWRSVYQIDQLDFGGKAFYATIISLGTGIMSGIGTIFVFLQGEFARQNKNRRVGVILSLIIAGLGMILKILFSAFGFLPFSALKPVFSELYEWMLYSQIPSFWSGLAIGWFLKNKR